MRQPSPTLSRRARLGAGGAASALVTAGVVCAVAIGGTLGQLLAFVLIALGLVLATAWVFLEVGLSEDRERAAAAPRAPRARPPRRLPRSDGHRRRL